MSACANLPARLYRAEQVRELDRIAIQELGIPGAVLMERAGGTAAKALRETWPDARRVAVLCGGGNNGGDGYVLARHCAAVGMAVSVFHLSDPERLKGDALDAYQKMTRTGLTSAELKSGSLERAHVIVDAIFGTGLDRDVTGAFADAIGSVNAASQPVLAIDIPSGLHADSGRVLGVAVEADLTLTFIGLKRGLLTGEGRAYCGAIHFDDLAVPARVYGYFDADCERIDARQTAHYLPRRARSAHKGAYGHVLVIGGERGYTGAARMAGEAAARVGAGLISLATRPENAATIGLGRPELMCHGVATATELEEQLRRATVVAVGPGLGQSDWAQAMLGAALDSKRPLVLDADALNLLARNDYRSDDWVLTPHPGEAARLLNSSTAEIQADRFAAVERLAKKFGGVSVLKGSGTLIRGPSGRLGLCSDGNPGMATGGMGDVLTGIIAGLAAQGMLLETAARLGVCLHARAADLAAEDGERGLLATDLMAPLRRLANPA
jgi:NAD(P)H-hydrate epimerase